MSPGSSRGSCYSMALADGFLLCQMHMSTCLFCRWAHVNLCLLQTEMELQVGNMLTMIVECANYKQIRHYPWNCHGQLPMNFIIYGHSVHCYNCNLNVSGLRPRKWGASGTSNCICLQMADSRKPLLLLGFMRARTSCRFIVRAWLRDVYRLLNQTSLVQVPECRPLRCTFVFRRNICCG